MIWWVCLQSTLVKIFWKEFLAVYIIMCDCSYKWKIREKVLLKCQKYCALHVRLHGTAGGISKSRATEAVTRFLKQHFEENSRAVQTSKCGYHLSNVFKFLLVSLNKYLLKFVSYFFSVKVVGISLSCIYHYIV